MSEDVARKVEEHLCATFLPDPHCDPALGGMYAITSLACDGPDFHVFYRDRTARNRKYRVRRYGDSDAIFLERKQSRLGRVRKRRVEAAVTDLPAISEDRAPHASHAWFLRELRIQDLAPVCRLRYLRRAMFAACPEGAMRVTFDRSIRGSLATSWSMEQQGEERALLDGLVICEFKFHNAMPAPLKAVAAALGLEATGVSKYRTCVRRFATELNLQLIATEDPAPATGVRRA